MNDERKAQIASWSIRDLRMSATRYNWLIMEAIEAGDLEKAEAYEEVREDLIIELKARHSG